MAGKTAGKRGAKKAMGLFVKNMEKFKKSS